MDNNDGNIDWDDFYKWKKQQKSLFLINGLPCIKEYPYFVSRQKTLLTIIHVMILR